MHNPIDIDVRHTHAISREISERLRVELGVEPALPAGLEAKFDELRRSEGQYSSIAPEIEREFENEPSENKRSSDTSPRRRSWLTWPWRRKG